MVEILVTKGRLQERRSNLHLVECHSTQWRFELPISPRNIWVDSFWFWLDSGFCVPATIFTWNQLELASYADSTLNSW